MFKSFKEYRYGMRDLGDASTALPPRDVTQIPASLDQLQREISVMIDTEIRNAINSLDQTGSQYNPLDVMRQNLSWKQKLGNWWNRMWHGNDVAKKYESTEYGLDEYQLEFSDDVLIEHEAFEELVSILSEYGASKPINTAKMYYANTLNNLGIRIKGGLAEKFEKFKTYLNTNQDLFRKQATPEGTPEEEPGAEDEVPAGHPQEDPEDPVTSHEEPGEEPTPVNPGDPVPPAHPADVDDVVADPAHIEDPTDNTEVPPVDPATQPPVVTPPGRQRKAKIAAPPVASEEPRHDLPVEGATRLKSSQDYGLVHYVKINGKNITVDQAGYDHNGDLVWVTNPKIPGRIMIPKQIGEKLNIGSKFGGRSGTIKQLRLDILNNANQQPAVTIDPNDTPPEDTTPKIDRSNLVRPPDKPSFNIPVNPDYKAPDHGDEEDELDDDEDHSANDEIKADQERAAKRASMSHEDRVNVWINALRDGDDLDMLNPKFLYELGMPDSTHKQSIMAFLAPINYNMRMDLLGSDSKLLDTPDEDLGKLQMIGDLGPERAFKVGEKLNKVKNVEAVMSDPYKFQEFLDNLEENVLVYPFPKRKNKTKTSNESIKALDIDRQVKRYKQKLQNGS